MAGQSGARIVVTAASAAALEADERTGARGAGPAPSACQHAGSAPEKVISGTG
jgi:hypothetical protein